MFKRTKFSAFRLLHCGLGTTESRPVAARFIETSKRFHGKRNGSAFLYFFGDDSG